MWKEELEEILFSNNPSKINAKRAIKLKYSNTPSSLYKYKPFDDKGYSLELLETNKMYLARPTEFNDPFDCGLKLASKDISDSLIKESLLEPIFDEIKQKYGCSYKQLDKLKRSKNIVIDLSKFIVKSNPNISLAERAKAIELQKKVFTEGYYNLGLKKIFMLLVLAKHINRF